jgi:hypothetical protein
MNAMANIDRAIDDAEELFVRAGRAKVKAEAEDMRRKRVRASARDGTRRAGTRRRPRFLRTA